MKICAIQTRPVKGDFEKNIESHKRLIDIAASNDAEIIIFPELSITSYESVSAKDWATHQNDKRFDEFQKISDAKQVVIGIGVPTTSEAGVLISMIIFQPFQPRRVYSKQHLHFDELPYFVNGRDEVLLTVKDAKAVPAICYESLLPEHSEKAFKNGVNVYLASVAKSAVGVEKACQHYSEIARKYSMIVLMSNCLGRCDDFESVGKSAVWNSDGVLAGQLDDRHEGILIFDTETQKLFKQQFASGIVRESVEI